VLCSTKSNGPAAARSNCVGGGKLWDRKELFSVNLSSADTPTPPTLVYIMSNNSQSKPQIIIHFECERCGGKELVLTERSKRLLERIQRVEQLQALVFFGILPRGECAKCGKTGTVDAIEFKED